MPWLSTAYESRKGRAARSYNVKIFFKFQKELILATKYEAQELQKDQVYAVLKSEYHRQFEFRTRRYIVTVDLTQKNYRCLCCKFEKDGIICCHIIKVLTNLNISQLDDSYFIERWRAKERKQLTRQNTVPEIEIEKSRPLRHNILSNKLSNIASDGSRTMETFNYVLEEAERMQRKLNELADEVRLQQSQSVQQSGTNVLQDANDAVRLPQTESAQESDTMLLQDPNNAQKRGRTKKVTRQIGIVEDIRSKAKSNFTCTHCREGGHNIKTCQKKHLPPVPKKQRKGNQEMLTTPINSSSASAASKAKKGKVKN
ncbi:unnamed protein product [Miscanthus lutarioriparius]|uniref:Protein FAR1-RELATED SEQUENCE n=1 Tax=Miscanthus lutarioriparius TaxID=422564 RepID=A0A811QE10_9POAL|nr:unnamed protein product [Miscanthus lutarioriparius]